MGKNILGRIAIVAGFAFLAQFAVADEPVTTNLDIENVAPMVTAATDNGSNWLTPTNEGENVTFTLNATDPNGDAMYLAICKTNAITAGVNLPPTCPGGSWYADTTERANPITDVSVSTSTAGLTAESNDWYAFACDKISGGGLCSPMLNTDSPFNVNHRPVIGTVGIGPKCNSTASIDPGNSRSAIATTEINMIYNHGQDVAVQQDGKMVVAGYTNNLSGGTTNRDFVVARYNTDGSLDLSFGGNGVVITDIGSTYDYAYAVAIQTDGKIVAAGVSGSSGVFTLVRYNTDGTLDTLFDGDGIVTTAVGGGNVRIFDLAIQPDGKIVAAGTGGTYDFAVARYNTNGSLDLSFGGGDGIAITEVAPGQISSANALALQANGKIVVAGNNTTATFSSDFTLVRLNADGSLDTTFGGGDGIVITAISVGNYDTASAVAIQTDGKIVAGGTGKNSTNYYSAVARFNIDGSLDTTFGGGDGIVTTTVGNSDSFGNDLKLQPDGKILTTGDFDNLDVPGYDYNFSLIRYNTDGTLDLSFGDGDGITTTEDSTSSDVPQAIALQQDGKIVVTGYGSFDAPYYNGPSIALVRYNADGSQDTTFGGGDGIVTTNAGGGLIDSALDSMIQPDGKTVVVGSSGNGLAFDFSVARYNADGALDLSFSSDGKLTTAIGSGFDAATGVALQPDGKIVVAGYSNNGSDNDFAVARYTTSGSLDTAFGTGGKVTTAVGSSSDVAYAVALQTDGKIVVAGTSRIDDTNYPVALVRYNSDGSLDTSFDTDGKVTTQVTSCDNYASAVAIQSDGKIVIVGRTSTCSKYNFLVARYNTDGSLDTSFSDDGIVSTEFASAPHWDYATAVVIQSDGKIVAAGRAGYSGVFNFAVARYNTDGSLDTTFGTDGKLQITFGSGDNTANSIVLQSDSKFVIGGYANNGSDNDFALARISSAGVLDTDFSGDGKLTTSIGSGADEAYGVALQSDGRIVAAGSSDNGANSDFALVRYTTTGALDDLSGYACTQVAVTDADINTAPDTVDVHVCATNSFTGTECGGTTLCMITGVRSGGSAQCTIGNQVPVPTMHGTYGAYVFLVDKHGFTDAGTANTQSYSVTDVAPTINSSNDYMVNDIALTAGGSTAKSYLATIRDDNGDVDLTGTTAVLYDDTAVDLVSGTCTASDQNCYPGIACAPDTTNGDNSLTYTCNPTAWFNSDYSSNWRLHANPTDGTNSPTGLTGSNAIATDALSAIDVPELAIAYGTVALGAISDGQAITLTNVGNQILDVLVQGTDMTGTPSGTIPLAQQKWHNTVQDFTYAEGNTLVASASGATTKATGCADLNLAVRAAHASGTGSDESLFWKLQIPATQKAGSYSGTNTFVAAAEGQCGYASPFITTTDFEGGADLAWSSIRQPDGKLVAAGHATISGNEDFALARYNVDGSLDSMFGTGGKVTTAISTANDRINAVALQPDGKLVAAGYGSSNAFALARYNTDGSLDSSFGTGGIVTMVLGGIQDYFQSVVIQPDGKIVVAGYAYVSGNYSLVVARYNADGSLDLSFGGGDGIATTAGRAKAVALQPDGKIVVGGMNTSPFKFTLARFSEDGLLDSSFGTDGIATTTISTSSRIEALALQTDGKIVAGGFATDTTSWGFALTRYNTDGSLDTSFGGGDGIVTTEVMDDDYINALALQTDGKIVAAGYSYASGSGTSYEFSLARYNTDGSLDTSFGQGDGTVVTVLSGGYDEASSVVVQPDGMIVLTGYTNDNDFAVVRYNADGSL